MGLNYQFKKAIVLGLLAVDRKAADGYLDLTETFTVRLLPTLVIFKTAAPDARNTVYHRTFPINNKWDSYIYDVETLIPSWWKVINGERVNDEEALAWFSKIAKLVRSNDFTGDIRITFRVGPLKSFSVKVFDNLENLVETLVIGEA